MNELENFEKYLITINNKLSEFFEKQKDYIKCHKGCAKCCKNAEFPFSFIEYKYLLSGFLTLTKENQNIIENNINEIIGRKKDFKDKKFLYDCPFLINDECSVYQYRSIICRTFGLPAPSYNGSNKTRLPFCHKYGLNYSMVVDKETNTISDKLYEKTGYKIPPLEFNVNYDFLTNERFERIYNFRFGGKKALINWFIDDKQN